MQAGTKLRLKELLDTISVKSYLLCEDDNPEVSVFASQINTAAFELKKIVERLESDSFDN